MKIISIILCLFPFIGNATKIYMSATGSDGAAGTSPATAWQTLTKLNTQFLTSGDTVFFNRGDVFYGRLNLTKTGAAGNPVVYTSYGSGADPVITGYTSLSGWTTTSITGVYAAQCANLKQYSHNLIMDGRLQNIARSPNTGFITYTNVSTTSITTSESSPPNHVNDSIVVKDSRFTLTHSKITAQAGSSYTVVNLTYTGAGGNGFFYFNAPKFLDTIGEWCVNSTLDSVYVYFGGPGPSGHTVSVATVDSLAYATGSFIHLDSLHFTGGNMANLLSPFGTGNIVANKCTFDYAYNAVDFRSQHDTIKNCVIRDILNNGYTTPTNNISKYSLLYGNTFRAVGLLSGMGGSGSGQYFTINNPSQGCTMRRNDIDSIGYNGIYFQGDSNVVDSNHINHFCVTLADGGGIYNWSATTISYTDTQRIIRNLVENGIGNIEGIVYDPGTMASGIYCDGKSNLISITDNTTINNSGAGLFDHGTNMTYLRNASYGNLLTPLLLSEFSGQPITGTIIKYNALASADTLRPCIWFYTPNANVLSMASASDSNYFMSGTGAIASLWTQQNGGPIVKRSLTDWRSFMSLDANSTHNKGIMTLAYNALPTNKNTYLTGKYTGPPGNTYVQLVPMLALSGIPLFVLDIGYVTFTIGTKVIPH
jgi:hypothetical protein